MTVEITAFIRFLAAVIRDVALSNYKWEKHTASKHLEVSCFSQFDESSVVSRQIRADLYCATSLSCVFGYTGNLLALTQEMTYP